MITLISEHEISSSREVMEVREMFDEAKEDLGSALRRLRAGEFGDAKEVAKQIGEVKAAYKLALEERTRVAKLRKDEAGIVYDYALDFDAARDEICRRLACLRDAGDGR
jgi:hypothetical protein